MKAIQKEFGLFAKSELFIWNDAEIENERANLFGINLHFKKDPDPFNIGRYLKTRFKL